MDSEMNLDLNAIEARAKAATLENFMRCPEDDHHCEIDGIDELNRIAREDIPALIAEVRRLEGELHVDPENEIKKLRARNKYLEGELEREKLSAQSAGEALDNVVADHKRDIARLADIKAKAVSALSKANPENEKWRCPEFAALAAALEGE